MTAQTKTPAEIATEKLRAASVCAARVEWLAHDHVHSLIIAAINADRAQFFDTAGSASSQHYIDTGRYMLHEEVAEMEALNAPRRPEIYIVQNDAGDVVDVFRDPDEASAAYQLDADAAAYSIIEETVSEPGEYAAERIAGLTAEWEESTGDTAADYVTLSVDDWAFGLATDDAAEIARLIEWTEGQK